MKQQDGKLTVANKRINLPKVDYPPNIIHIKEMTDSEFQQTKRILLEQERMNREYTQLANYIQERLSVQVINVTCTKEKIQLI